MGPGNYQFSTSAALTGTLTLDGNGDPDSQFIFMVGTSFAADGGSNIALINGAQARNVIWVVGTSATVAAAASMAGDMIAGVSITMAAGATFDGRLLALSAAVTLSSNVIAAAPATSLATATESTTASTTSPATTITDPTQSATTETTLADDTASTMSQTTESTALPLTTSTTEAPESSCPLGTAGGFAVLAGTTITNTGLTVISGGQVAVHPGTAITGFGLGQVLAPFEVLATASNVDLLLSAKSDLATALACYFSLAPTHTFGAENLGGLTLAPGIHAFATTAAFSGILTLDGNGDANSQFVFVVGTSVTVAAGSTINLINGARASNVKWIVGTSMTVSAEASLSGDILVGVSLTMAAGATSNGRLLVHDAAVTLSSNSITVPVLPLTMTTSGTTSATSNATTTPICGSSNGMQCSSDSDCGGTDANQAGLCTVSGFCQCGFGYRGVGTILDPTACEYVCTPPALPDALTFLNEPELESFAEDGNLVVRVTVDPFLKQHPGTIAMQHPQTGERCGILWERLGMCELSQTVNPGNCWTTYEWRRRWDDVVGNSGCFLELPNVTESGPGYTLVSRRFRTIFEVAMSGLAPFGLNATRKRQSEVTVQRILRREYTFSIAVRLMVESNPFTVVANGALRYRLVEIDTMPLAGKVKIVVQTRVAVGARVSTLQVNLTASRSLPTMIENAQMPASCSAQSPVNYCDQFHTITFSLTPCSVDGELVLTAGLQCDDPEFANDLASCGFLNAPLGNVYTMDNLIVQYDSCPRSKSYGIDLGQSGLSIYTDPARSKLVDAPLEFDSTVFGRISLRALGSSKFSSATLQSLNLVRQGSPNVDLGNQLTSTIVTLVSPSVNTDRLNPVFDFAASMAPAVFDLSEVYFWQAALDTVFEETGNLTKRHQIVQYLEPRAIPVKTEGVTSRSFELRAESGGSVENGALEGSVADGTGIVIAAIAGGVIAAVIVIIIVVGYRRRHRQKQLVLALDAPQFK